MKKFENYQNNLRVLETAGEQDLGNNFVLSGIVDIFNIQFELSWKVLKELLIYEGDITAKTGSPREIMKEAYRFYPCLEEEVWMDMLSQRNNMAHIYDNHAAKKLVEEILIRYIPSFQQLEKSILEKYGGVLKELS